MNFSPLAIVADLLLVIGFGLGVAGLALISLALALGVSGLVLIIAGVLLSVLSVRRPPPGVPGKHGPFDPDTARQD